MKNLHNILGIIICFSLLFSGITCNAAEIDNKSISNEACYDLDKGGTNIFNLTDTDGNIYTLTITEVPPVSRVSKGSYKITLTSKGAWSAGFTIDVANNSISRAYSPFARQIIGLISSSKLKVDSSKQASLRFLYHNGVFKISTGVIAYISGTKLKSKIA